jgi:FAD:protein FMN transferase
MAAMLGLAAFVNAAPQKFAFEKAEMGIRFSISIFAEDEAGAKADAEAAFAKIAALNQIFSDYEPESELSKLSATAGSGRRIPVSLELWEVLSRARTLAEKSGGAFDPTCGPLTAIWRRARRKNELPSASLVEEMRARCGWEKLSLHPADKTAELRSANMRLDLGAIAKGYACDHALEFLREKGRPISLVAGAGDMAIGAAPPGRKGWKIAIEPLDAINGARQPPTLILELANCAIATSGDRYQRLDAEGRRFSHILDLRTGQPLQDHSLVTVVAANCITADSLSTVLSALGPQEGLRLASEFQSQARWQRQPGAEVEIATTPGWDALLK